MATSPTQRSLKLLRGEDYTAQVVEKYITWTQRRIDLFGFIDIVAMKAGSPGLLGVQTTSGSNLTKRIKKATALPECELWLLTGNSLEFHGWRKLKNLPGNKQWDCDRRIMTLKDLGRGD